MTDNGTERKPYPHTERDATIVQMIDNGIDIRCIAEMFSLSRERIRQIITAQARESNAQEHRKKATSLRKERNRKKCRCGNFIGKGSKKTVQCKKCYTQSMNVLFTNSKLTAEQVMKVDLELRQGRCVREIASEVGITTGAVYHIQSGYTWSKITGRKRIKKTKNQSTT